MPAARCWMPCSSRLSLSLLCSSAHPPGSPQVLWSCQRARGIVQVWCGADYSFKAHFCCLHACACPRLWHEGTSSKPCWFHLLAQLMRTLDLLVVFVQVHCTKAEVSFPHRLQVPSDMHGGSCVGGEPLREAVSLHRGNWRRNKRFWLGTSVWVNYLPQFLEQLSVMLSYFFKAHFV